MSLATISRDVLLAPFTSWQVGGKADFFIQPVNVDELTSALLWALQHRQPWTVISGGTNVLVSDQGVRGLVISLRKMSGLNIIERDGFLFLECLAGTSKSDLLKTFLKYKLEPALFLAGLPGDVGGGVVMNAGVGEMIQPREFVEVTDWVEVVRVDSKGQIDKTKFSGVDLKWTYRHCSGWQPGIVSRVGLKWPLKQADDVLTRVKQANQSRLLKQPLDLPSCGSVFVNPEGHKSGQLIESCGLKGYAIGGAQVSNKHANFIVNTGGATAQDIDSVIHHVKSTVLLKKGVHLKTEVVYLGEW